MATNNNNIHVVAKTLIPQGTLTPSRVASPPMIRNRGKDATSTELAKDLESLSKTLNGVITTLSTQKPEISQILVTDQQGNVVAFLGSGTYNGEYFNNFLSEIHVGDPLNTNDPSKALFNANIDGTVTVGEHGSMAVLDPYGQEAAWIGTQDDAVAVTGAADNGAGLIRLTVTGHDLVTGNVVQVLGVEGVGQAPPVNGTFRSNANGVWTVTVIDATHIDLQGSVWAGTYGGGGGVSRLLQIASLANHSGLIRVVTNVAHGYETGDKVNIQGTAGVPNAIGQWIITVIDPTTFDLQGSTFAGAYTGGGNALRYFAGMLAQTIAIGPNFIDYKLREFADGSLRIRNAVITLTTPAGVITLDPSIPAITLADSGGNILAQLDILQDPGITVTSATNAGPSVLTVPGNTYVNGDTVRISGAVGNTAINGEWIVENVGTSGPGTFTMTDFALNPVDGNGPYTAGSATSVRYFAGLLAETLALGTSWTSAKVRFFPDGRLVVNDATLNSPILNTPTVTGGFTGTATVRNAAGTGTSSFTFSGGVCTAFAP